MSDRQRNCCSIYKHVLGSNFVGVRNLNPLIIYLGLDGN